MTDVSEVRSLLATLRFYVKLESNGVTMEKAVSLMTLHRNAKVLSEIRKALDVYFSTAIDFALRIPFIKAHIFLEDDLYILL